jgi:hypothetical protein
MKTGQHSSQSVMENSDLEEEFFPPLPAEILLQRGFCCGNGCQNCPYIDEYGQSHQKGSVQVSSSVKGNSPEV